MVDYNPFATTFSASRKNMKWPEIEYFFQFLGQNSLFLWKEEILDVGCGNGRLVELMDKYGFQRERYTGIDISSELIQEARKSFPWENFVISDMQDPKVWEKEKFSLIFFIASFHHLKGMQEREKVLKIYTDKLLPWGYLCMTNWALESWKNAEKYKSSLIQNSENLFNSKDFSIKIWKHQRYYHSFSLWELGFLAEESGLLMVENRLFQTENNIISIFQKKAEKDL